MFNYALISFTTAPRGDYNADHNDQDRHLTERRH